MGESISFVFLLLISISPEESSARFSPCATFLNELQELVQPILKGIELITTCFIMSCDGKSAIFGLHKFMKRTT